jgi:hypothetical protein
VLHKIWYSVDLIRSQNPQIGSFVILQHGGVHIYYLITKKHSRGYPLLSDLRLSLSAMRDHAVANGIKLISMPAIGSGLDWKDVRRVIEEVFSDSPVDINIFFL